MGRKSRRALRLADLSIHDQAAVHQFSRFLREVGKPPSDDASPEELAEWREHLKRDVSPEVLAYALGKDSPDLTPQEPQP